MQELRYKRVLLQLVSFLDGDNLLVQALIDDADEAIFLNHFLVYKRGERQFDVLQRKQLVVDIIIAFTTIWNLSANPVLIRKITHRYLFLLLTHNSAFRQVVLIVEYSSYSWRLKSYLR